MDKASKRSSDIESVGIVGAGTMGSRIAFQSALWGKEVFVYDIAPLALERAMTDIARWLQERATEEKRNDSLRQLHACADLAECVAHVGLVIETVPENLQLKRSVFAEIDRIAPAHVLIATNSSSLPSSRLADATTRPDKVFNYNFSDPIHGELLVEVMAHAGTAEQTLVAAERFVKSIGLVPVVLKREIMGFALNRIWRAIKKEALHLAAEGYADHEDIDRAWILTYGTRLGPFARMDEIGLDVIRDIEMQYYLNSGDEGDKPPQFLNDWVAQGRLGVKSGHGFYSYPNPVFERPGWLRKEHVRKE